MQFLYEIFLLSLFTRYLPTPFKTSKHHAARRPVSLCVRTSVGSTVSVLVLLLLDLKTSFVYAHSMFGTTLRTPLLPVDINDDLFDAVAIVSAATWTDARLAKCIDDKVTRWNALAGDLLKQLLRVNPRERPESMDAVLAHPFFQSASSSSSSSSSAVAVSSSSRVASVGAGVSFKYGDITDSADTAKGSLAEQVEETKSRPSSKGKSRGGKAKEEDIAALAADIILENTVLIRNLTDPTLKKIRKSEKVLREGLFESSEVQIPSCIVVLPDR